MSTKLADLLLLITAIFWGLGYIGVDILQSSGLTSFAIIALRFFIAFLVLFIIFLPKMKFKLRELLPIFAVGSALFFAFLFQTVAMSYTTTTNVSFITSMNIIFVPIISYLLFKEKMKFSHLIAIIITMVSLVILTGGIKSLNIGDILTVICAFLFGLHIVLISYFSKSVDITRLAVGQMFVTAMLATICCILLGQNLVQQTSLNIGVLLFVGLVPSALCFFLQNIGLKYASPSKGSIILGTEALWGALFSIGLLGEPFTINVLIGGTLMLSALFVDNINLFKKNS